MRWRKENRLDEVRILRRVDAGLGYQSLMMCTQSLIITWPTMVAHDDPELFGPRLFPGVLKVVLESLADWLVGLCIQILRALQSRQREAHFARTCPTRGTPLGREAAAAG